MRPLSLRNDGFFSLSIYFILIYLLGVYYHYYNRFQLIYNIRENLIEIYITKIELLIS